MNLKGGTELLRYYRNISSEDRKRLIEFEKNGVFVSYQRTEQDTVYFNEGDVARFSLDHALGYNAIPVREGNFTMVSNYLIDYWGYFLKASTYLYIILRRHCFNKDYCFVSLETLANKMGVKSVVTIRSQLEMLQNYGFIFQFLVKNEKNMDDTPITKVRKEIPLLTYELIQQLPDRLRKSHDALIKELTSSSEATKLILPFVNVTSVYETFVDAGKLQNPESIKRNKDLVAVKFEQYRSRMDESDQKIVQFLYDRLSRQVDKHIVDTFIKPFVLHYDRDRRAQVLAINIYFDNIVSYEFVVDHLQDRIHTLITEYFGSIGKPEINFIVLQ